MPRVTDPDDPEERRAAELAVFLACVPLLHPVTPADPHERRLWRACELCTFLEYRLAGAPDPRALTDAAIADWARRGLADGEAPGDPARLLDYRPYWLMADGRRLGTVAVAVRDHGFGLPSLRIASLYLFPEERGRGHGDRVMEALEATARHLGLGAVRLETDWLWQGAVRFYLRRGYWVQNWKHCLSLVRHFADPGYRVQGDGDRLEFVIRGAAGDRVLISARRRGEQLIWEGHAGGRTGEDDEDTRASPAPTFALHLAVGGWPLIRGAREWAQRSRWTDTGMPEGLAAKIAIFEAHARHRGFRVDTPQIPGLRYPTWYEFQAD